MEKVKGGQWKKEKKATVRMYKSLALNYTDLNNFHTSETPNTNAVKCFILCSRLMINSESNMEETCCSTDMCTCGFKAGISY